MVMHVELQATCSSLGYIEGNKYVKEPDCLEAIKDLIRFLKREDDSFEIRRELGNAQIVQNDLLHIIKWYSHDEKLFDAVIRLLVNLTQPAILCFNNTVPTEKTIRNIYIEIESILQSYKEAFVDEELFNALTQKLGDLLKLDWEHRQEEDRLLIERILILIRNVLHVPPNEDREQRTDDDATVHDQVIWAIHCTGLEDLLLYIASSEDERNFSMHILEIVSLMFREQNPEILQLSGVQRSMTEKEKDESNQAVKTEMGGWGLRFSQDLVQINARVAPPEKIMQRYDAVLNYKQEDADWSRDMRGKELVTPVDLQRWVIVFTRKNSVMAQDLVQTLSKVGPPMGMRIAQPTPCEIPDDRNDSYLSALRQQVQQDTQMALCILPTNRKDRYDAIKKFCCVDHPVPSQVVVGRTLSKKQMLMSVATKIAIQLNCKLGGEVWHLEIPLKNLMVIGIDSYHDSAKKGRSVGGVVASINPALTRYYSRCTFQHSMQELSDGLKLKGLMVVGIDTYHDSAKKGRSVGGIVCSMNRNLTRYYSSTTFQMQTQELVDGACIKLRGALEKYHEVNGALPERIIVFRDGVGDGQLQAVHEHEIPQMIDCFKKAGGTEYSPKVGVVVVKKRINTRFFASLNRGQLGNPPPGTIIDTEVTKPEWYDFFLVSQSVRQGTVTPTHYNVVWDTTGLKPDHMQRLTYKMCHLYYNWPGTIRVPAPCQYAHKLAFLVGQSIHRDPSPALADRLYFL
ncbi:aubergine [Mytilus galloprovincialis]|uniref:Aubergine n=1 Tax=Mytilus galloprovincialis TaxID=29158 RepID=A0A8B6HDJ1_MYTGA|nr:aubergine [Mytilus galloprovincialis]